MTPTHNIVSVTQGMVDYLKLGAPSLGIEEVYYGDERLIPSFPSVCVDPAGLTRTYVATGFRTNNNFVLYVLVYHGPIQTLGANRKECDTFATNIMNYIHQDLTLGGLVINGLCTALEPGGSQMENQEFVRAHRITWTALSKTMAQEVV